VRFQHKYLGEQFHQCAFEGAAGILRAYPDGSTSFLYPLSLTCQGNEFFKLGDLRMTVQRILYFLKAFDQEIMKSPPARYYSIGVFYLGYLLHCVAAAKR